MQYVSHFCKGRTSLSVICTKFAKITSAFLLKVGIKVNDEINTFYGPYLLWSVRRPSIKGGKSKTVTYSANGKDELRRIIIVSLTCVSRVRERVLLKRRKK